MKNILLIDDDREILFILKTMITRHFNHTVVAVDSGKKANVWLKSRAWDLIISDINLPDCNGLSMVKNIRKFNPDAKILMITGAHKMEHVIKAMHLKVDSFLLKPFAQKDFLDQVITLIKTTKPIKKKRKVLAIGAHPDDVEIGCGGTLFNHMKDGDEISILTLSTGEMGGNPSVRCNEAEQASKLLGAQLKLEDLGDTIIGDGPKTIKLIEHVISEVEPDVIYTHSKNDAHQDHRSVYRATMVAARKVPVIECYQSPSATTEFNPSRFVDISNHLKNKIELLACYETQLSKCEYLKNDFIKANATYWGRFANYSLVEPFEVIRSM